MAINKRFASEEYVNEGIIAARPDWYQNDETAADYIKNKPFGETTVMGDTVTFDGDLTGKTYVSMEMTADDEGNTVTVHYVQVSDSVPTMEDLQNGVSAGTTQGVIEVSVDSITDIGVVLYFEVLIIVKEDNTDLTDVFGVVFPKKGVYVMHIPDAGVSVTSLTINGYTGFERTEIIPLPERYLPQFDEAYRTYFHESGAKLIKYDEDNNASAVTYAEFEKAYYKGQIVINWSGTYYTPMSIKLIPPYYATLSIVHCKTGSGAFEVKKFSVGDSLD